MKRLALVVLPLLGMTGCLFDLNGPGPANQVKRDFKGFAKMVDYQGALMDAWIEARFLPDTASSSAALLMRNLRDTQWDGSLRCQVLSDTYSKKEEAEPASPYVEVGKISFRNLLQGTDASIPLELDKRNRYLKTLPPRMAPGIYVVEAKTADNSYLFSENLSMPETLNEALANGMQYSVGLFAKKEEGIELRWQAPTTTPERNLIEAILFFDIEKNEEEIERHMLNCNIMESYLLESAKEGTIVWEIPAKWVDQLPISQNGVFLLSRVHGRGRSVPELTFWGYRTLITRSRLDPADE